MTRDQLVCLAQTARAALIDIGRNAWINRGGDASYFDDCEIGAIDDAVEALDAAIARNAPLKDSPLPVDPHKET